MKNLAEISQNLSTLKSNDINIKHMPNAQTEHWTLQIPIKQWNIMKSKMCSKLIGKVDA